MTNREMNLLLIEGMPNLRERIEDEIFGQEGDDTGAYIVVEMYYMHICANV